MMADITIGAIIISCCIGSLYGAAFGWLSFGVFLVLTGLATSVMNVFKQDKK